MTVELDQPAKNLIKLLNGFPKFNVEYINQINDELRGKGKTGANIIEQHFEKKAGGKAKIYTSLEPGTIKRKTTSLMMVESGDLKRATLKTMKPKISGRKVTFKAKVPEYGKRLRDGIEVKGPPKRQKVYDCFNIFKSEQGLFDRMTQSVLDFLILSKGVK